MGRRQAEFGGKRAMKPTRKLNRRSFMARVAGGVAAGGALILVSDEAGRLQCSRFRQRPQFAIRADAGAAAVGAAAATATAAQTAILAAAGAAVAVAARAAPTATAARTAIPADAGEAAAEAAAATAPTATRPLCRLGWPRPPLRRAPAHRHHRHATAARTAIRPAMAAGAQILLRFRQRPLRRSGRTRAALLTAR